MPRAKITSMRALAHKLGVSVATVSDALRNNPRVSVDTRLRVQVGAKRLGYDYNPLAGAVMSRIRRSAVGTYHGTVAVVDIELEWERPKGAARYHALMAQGAKEAAENLGFNVDFMTLRDRNRSQIQLNRMLYARGIRAVLFLPIFGTPSLSGIDWDRLTSIYSDYMIEDPPINRTCPNHFAAMTLALDKLAQMGYKRPGLVMLDQQDRRLRFSWEAAFSCYWSHLTQQPATVPLVLKELNRQSFVEWFRATKPDVVMAHSFTITQWMTDLGCSIPETHGFCCLNVSTIQGIASGLDLLPHTGGARAMEALIGQLLRNEFGIPESPSTLTYPARWHDGPTLRSQ